MQTFRSFVTWPLVVLFLLFGPTLLAQTATVAGIPTSVPLSPASDVWGNSFMWAYASSWAMRWLREHPSISLFSSDTSLRIQRCIGALIAFLNGLGITFVFDQQAGTLLIGGLFWSAAVAGIRQFFLQEFVYFAALRRKQTAA